LTLVFLVAPLLAAQTAPGPPPLARSSAGADRLIPAEFQGWRAAEPVQSYSPATVYDYMDGGAEVYLSYGMEGLQVRVFRRPGEPSITLNVFRMASPGAAFGAFTFERLDGPAGIGQDSEYGAGILRFWQGSHFVFIQAERETPACKTAILALGRLLADRLGMPGAAPRLPAALPAAGLRPLSVRYVLTPQLLTSMEAIAQDNAFNLPARCEGVAGRYGKPGDPERVLILRYGDAGGAQQGLAAFLKGRTPRPWILGQPTHGPSGWSCATAQGALAVLVLDAADAEAARARMIATCQRLKEVAP
jgi:hypothetical protein